MNRVGIYAALALALLLAGCVSPQQQGSPGADQSPQVGVFNWLTGFAKGMFGGARLGDDLAKGAKKSQAGADVLESGAEKQTIQNKVSLIHVESGSLRYLIVGLVMVLGMAYVLLKALRTVVAAVGRTGSTQAAGFVKAETHVNPLLHPIRWLMGKVIGAVAEDANAKVSI